MNNPICVQSMTTALEATGDFRVLRRVDHSDLEGVEAIAYQRVGVVVDVETTGVDPSTAKIIEFAARMFWATSAGEIVAVGPLRSWLEYPGCDLPPEIVRLTGISDKDLAFERIDDAEAGKMLSGADFIVAHNASFDRQFVERRFPDRAGLAWACSCRDIDWAAHGFDGRGLGWLLAQSGLFHDGHRAGADVDATIALLRHCLPNGRTVLAEVLDTAERPTWHVKAVGAHFDVKDALTGRGYRWDAAATVWWRDVADDALSDERVWLLQNVYRPEFRPRALEPVVKPINWLTRYAG